MGKKNRGKSNQQRADSQRIAALRNLVEKEIDFDEVAEEVRELVIGKALVAATTAIVSQEDLLWVAEEAVRAERIVENIAIKILGFTKDLIKKSQSAGCDHEGSTIDGFCVRCGKVDPETREEGLKGCGHDYVIFICHKDSKNIVKRCGYESCRKLIQVIPSKPREEKRAGCEHKWVEWIDGKEGKEARCAKVNCDALVDPSAYDWEAHGYEPFGDDVAKDEMEVLWASE